MSLLKQNITRKGQIYKHIIKLYSKMLCKQTSAKNLMNYLLAKAAMVDFNIISSRP